MKKCAEGANELWRHSFEYLGESKRAYFRPLLRTPVNRVAVRPEPKTIISECHLLTEVIQSGYVCKHIIDVVGIRWISVSPPTIRSGGRFLQKSWFCLRFVVDTVKSYDMPAKV